MIRILLADDHAVVRQGLRMFLALEPELEVVGEAANGAQALEQVALLRPDVVLMDLKMPVMDGLTATREIRLHEATLGLPRTPLVMLTANAMPEHVAAGQAAGADSHLSKPFNAAELLSLVETPQALLAQHRIAA